MDILQSLSSWFWNPSFWLPPGIDWDMIKNPNPLEIRFPETKDILYVFPGALVFVLLRIIAERFIFKPLGHQLGIVSKVQKLLPPPNSSLEVAFTSNKGKLPTTNDDFEKLVKVSGMTRREIERWFRRRVVSTNQFTKLDKFSECLWRGCCYLVSFTIGIVILWDKMWVSDMTQCWKDLPYHNVTKDVQIYMLVGASIYTSFAITQFFDVRRKDFWAMFIHHITTLLLMTFTWLTNIVRVSTLVLFLHDCSDLFLEFAKVMNYAKQRRLSEALFAIFVIIWVVTRLYIYPSYIIYSINYEAQNYIDTFPMFTLMSYLSYVLLYLHLFWSWHIFKLLIHSYYTGAYPDRDVRSSTESSTTERENE